MENSEENMINLKGAKLQVTVRDSRTPTGIKHGNWHGYQRRDGKIHHLTLSNMAIILGLHINIYRVT